MNTLQEPLSCIPERQIDKFSMFLATEWISGSDDSGLDFDLVAGAGCGSPLMRLTVRKNGQRVEEVVDIRDMLTAWVTRIADEMTM